MNYPLPLASLSSAPIEPDAMQRLGEIISTHIQDKRYPGAQIALAHKGSLVWEQSFGQARVGHGHEADTKAMAADKASLWLLYSNTKIIMATLLWRLHEQGKLRFTDRVTQYLPEFGKNGKDAITLFQLITHQGGFPDGDVPSATWNDHAKVREAVCNFHVQWEPGSRISYHGLSAHWVLAMVIEAVTGQDFRNVIRSEVLEPLGLAKDLFVGLPQSETPRMAFLYEPDDKASNGLRLRDESTSRVWQEAGVPGGGAYGTARGMVALYQMMLQGGMLNGVRLVSPRTLAYAIQNYTGDRVDAFMGIPMHRGLGPHLRGTTIGMRGLGSLAKPDTFGHGGVGTSYCWADPQSGLSFAYITNARVPDPWHSIRLDQVSNLIHASIKQ
ncbi:MAG: beta-lactamase family protein [Burkholderiales bacterium]|nr:beta-lactamase family protein [Burkholderiales bacterium]